MAKRTAARATWSPTASSTKRRRRRRPRRRHDDAGDLDDHQIGPARPTPSATSPLARAPAHVSQIERVHARQILDSRGNPTVEVEIGLRSGAHGHAAVPSGASTGEFEATELRDGGEAWGGKGVSARRGERQRRDRRRRSRGLDAADQQGARRRADRARRHARTSRAWAPTRSSACRWRPRTRRRPRRGWRCGAISAATPRAVLPVPMMNVLNGGAHADNKVDFQEFMVVPCGAPSFSRVPAHGHRGVPRAEGARCTSAAWRTAVGDEGGFAPDLGSNEEALKMLVAGIEAAGYAPGEDVAIALDPATSELLQRRRLRARARGPHARAPPSWPTTGPTSPGATRSSRSRTAWTRRTGTAGRRSPSASATACSSSATTCS